MGGGQREGVSSGEAQRERRFCADSPLSAEPDWGLDLKTKIMIGAKTRNQQSNF